MRPSKGKLRQGMLNSETGASWTSFIQIISSTNLRKYELEENFGQLALKSARLSMQSLHRSLTQKLSVHHSAVSLVIGPETLIRKEQGSVFIGALQALEARLLLPPLPSQIPMAPTPPAVLYDPSPGIDYSSLFPVDMGHHAGQMIFRIEMLVPVVLDAELYGSFCVADSYIVLISSPKNLESADGELKHQVYTWIGAEAETDKRFCCAMYAVALRNVVRSTERILRQSQGEEALEFCGLFDGKMELLDISHATETGLYMAEERRYPIKLYRIDDKSQIPFFLVRRRW